MIKIKYFKKIVYKHTNYKNYSLNIIFIKFFDIISNYLFLFKIEYWLIINIEVFKVISQIFYYIVFEFVINSYIMAKKLK